MLGEAQPAAWSLEPAVMLHAFGEGVAEDADARALVQRERLGFLTGERGSEGGDEDPHKG